MFHFKNIIRLRVYILTVLLCNSIVFSFPHLGDRYDLKQPDGSFVPVLVWGDEFYQRVEDLNGYSLVRNDQNWICYATLNSDRSEFIPTTLIYKGTTSTRDYNKLRATNIVPGLEISSKAIGAKRALAIKSYFPNGQNYFPSSTFRSNERQTVIGVTFLVDFSDQPAQIDKAKFVDFLHKDGYTEYGNSNSIKGYFYKVSGGKFTFENLLVGYIRANKPKSYYDENVSNSKKPIELIEEIINTAAKTVDFSSLTVGITGCVLAVSVLYAGFPAWGWAKGLWPHSSLGGLSLKVQNKTFTQYQITNIGNDLSIGTYLHECCHMVIYLPDLYDYNGTSSGVGTFCIMNNNAKKIPQPICLPLKARFTSWVSPIDLTVAEKGKTYKIVSNSTSYYAFKYSGSREYFYLESAINKGDQSSYMDWGLLIWHSDNDAPDDFLTGTINDYPQMTAAQHYAVSLEQADGQYHMEKNRGYGHYGDLFQSKGNNNFNDKTTPNSKWWNGNASGFDLYNISCVGDTMSFVFGEPGVLVTRPQSAETLFINNTYKIQWTTKAGNTKAKIEVSYDGGSNYSEIANVNNVNTYDWKVSGNQSDDCIIRLTDNNISGTTAPFTIRNAPVIVVEKNISQEVKIGTDKTVTIPIQNTGKGLLEYRAESYIFSKNIIINEVYMGEYQVYPANGVELLNIGPEVDMTGWRYVWRDNAANMTQTMIFPTGYKFKSGKTLVLSKLPVSPCDSVILIPTKINWHKPDTLKMAVWLLNSAGIGVDFVKNAKATDYEPPAGCTWTGAGIAINQDGLGIARKTINDNDNVNDWTTVDTSKWTVNKLNAGQYLSIRRPLMVLNNYAGKIEPLKSGLITCNLNTKDLPKGIYYDTIFISHTGTNEPSPIRVIFKIEVKDSVGIILENKIPDVSFVCLPNPFKKNGSLKQAITFKLTLDNVIFSSLKIYDGCGNCVRSFSNTPGRIWVWDIRNTRGFKVASGSYVAVLTIVTRDGTKQTIKKMVGIQE